MLLFYLIFIFRVLQIPAFNFVFRVLQIPAFRVSGFTDSGFSCSGFYRFRLFVFRVLQIPAFRVPGFTDSGFSCSGFYRFRLFVFRVLQIPTFRVPGFTDSGFSCSGFYRFRLFMFRVFSFLVPFLVPFPDFPFLVLQIEIAILGPLLFIIYVNDLPNCLKYTKCNMFADDTQIDASCNNIESIANVHFE